MDILEDYLWVVGFGLFIGGLNIIFQKFPIDLVIAGLIIILIGVVIKSVRRQKK